MVLIACTKLPVSQLTSSSEQTQTVSHTVPTADDYRLVFVNNTYPISKSRGITANLITPTNIAAFEKGLLNISKSQFPTNAYYFLEGQFIDSAQISEWLSVQSDAKPNGLNTTIPGQRDIIVSILEQDYMQQVDNNYALSGMSIGIALNPTVSATVTLSDKDLLTIGKNASVKMLETLRKKDGMQSIPIVFALYRQVENYGVSKGAYLMSGVSTNGTTITKWTPTKVERRVFPLDIDKPNEISQFTDFKKQIESFFPNLNGVVGEAVFLDDVMTELDVTITTQFYGQSEMLGLMQFVVEQASRYNKEGLRVTIKIETVRGIEAVVFKAQNETVFHSVLMR